MQDCCAFIFALCSLKQTGCGLLSHVFTMAKIAFLVAAIIISFQVFQTVNIYPDLVYLVRKTTTTKKESAFKCRYFQIYSYYEAVPALTNHATLQSDPWGRADQKKAKEEEAKQLRESAREEKCRGKGEESEETESRRRWREEWAVIWMLPVTRQQRKAITDNHADGGAAVQRRDGVPNKPLTICLCLSWPLRLPPSSLLMSLQTSRHRATFRFVALKCTWSQPLQANSMKC